ncbi:MAG: substrate-binding domain-containing protein [Spartobacteria bacterium]
MEIKRNILLAITTTHHGLYRGVARFAREHNWHLTTDTLYAATIPRGWKGDGIISHVGYWKELADFISETDCPRVELTNTRPDLAIPCVEGDNHEIGAMAARHFLERGYRNFAWFPFTNDSINNERRDGFAETIAAEGWGFVSLPALHELKNLKWQGNWAKNLARIAKELAALPKPVAIFCYNDCAAANVLSICQDLGIPVPEQVAIAGVDNDELLCEAVTVPLTSVIHDLEGVGYQGAALLERLMNGEKAPAKIPRISPKGIVLRRSTDMQAVENIEVARALSHIRKNFHLPNLQVPDIVDATKVSRRPLEINFKREVGRTIHEEIVRQRIDKAKDLLAHSKQSVGAIAVESGFGRVNQLHRTFRMHTGETPWKYRMRLSKDKN